MLQQRIFYPFQMFSSRRDGSALRVAVVDGPCYESPRYGTVHTTDASASWARGRCIAFLFNRRISELAERVIRAANDISYELGYQRNERDETGA